MLPELFHAFNSTAITRLSLHKCSGAFDFLGYFAQTQQNSKITALEITSVDDDFLGASFCLFMDALRGLQHLYIRHPRDQGWRSIIRRLIQHKATLQRIVLHGLDQGDVYDTNPQLLPPSVLGSDDIRWRSSMEKIVACEHVKSIGITPYPGFLVT